MHRGDNDYCKPPSATYLLAPKPIAERLTLIHKETTPEGLFQLMNPGRSSYHAINFQHIPTRGHNKTGSSPIQSGTIEFRQHEGTLDPNECSAWVQVIAGLIRTAHFARIFTKLPDWGTAAERGRFTYNNLLEKIGKPHLVPFYSTRIDRIRHVPQSSAIEPPTHYSDSSMASTLVSLPLRAPLPKADSRAKSILRKSMRVLSCRRSRRDSSPDGVESGRANQRVSVLDRLCSRKQKDERGKDQGSRHANSRREKRR